jgi:hypothetical protein
VADQVREAFEMAVPGLDIGDRLAEHLVVGDGDMDGVHPALPHLAEDLFRPVRVLKPIDDHARDRCAARASLQEQMKTAPADVAEAVSGS